jgi:hypothetical protein
MLAEGRRRDWKNRIRGRLKAARNRSSTKGRLLYRCIVGDRYMGWAAGPIIHHESIQYYGNLNICVQLWLQQRDVLI